MKRFRSCAKGKVRVRYSKRGVSIAFNKEVDKIRELTQIKEDDFLLDVGCGNGTLLNKLKDYKCILFGIDISVKLIQIAKNKINTANFIIGNGENLPFKENIFTKLINQHLLEHIEDGLNTLKEWSKVLKRNGILVILTPNNKYPYKWHFYDPTHIHIYTPEKLKNDIENSGFRVDEIETIFPPIPISYFRVKYYESHKNSKFFKMRGGVIVLKAVRLGAIKALLKYNEQSFTQSI